MTDISNTGFWYGNNIIHAYSKPLINWIIEYLKDQKDNHIYDFGCGFGQYLQKLQEAGFKKLTGFEGNVSAQKIFDNIKQQDLTKPFVLSEQGNCIWLEVAEHIPEQYIDTAIYNITSSCNNKLIMSWAIRGQARQGHVNCLNNDEAILKITKYGLKYLEEDTLSARSVIDPNKCSIEGCELPWFKNTTLIFQKV